MSVACRTAQYITTVACRTAQMASSSTALTVDLVYHTASVARRTAQMALSREGLARLVNLLMCSDLEGTRAPSTVACRTAQYITTVAF